MSSVSRLFLFTMLVLLGGHDVAFARLPSTSAEHSLLYWRYLCRGEKQEETIRKDEREFKCLSQSWIVRTPASSGVVKEIIDEAP
jgi:hypothetical protein